MLLKYIAKHRLAFIAYFIFAAVLITAFLLYRLPISAVAYPLVLCAVVGFTMTVVDAIISAKKHERLTAIAKNPSVDEADYPLATSWEDEDYRRIISALKDEANRLANAESVRFADTVDYYTTWAHQIKTPIASMRLRLQGEDSDTARKLTAELNRIEQYVEMALTYARLDSSSTDYVFAEYELDGIIRQALRRFSSDFISKKLRLDYTETKLKIVTDEKWLSFIIEQVLSNAVKYTEQGCITVCLSSPSVLMIKDTGIGIVESDLPRIFEKGYTGMTGRTDKKASGIGLYLVKRITDNLGITVSAKSKPGTGTEIYINLENDRAKPE